MATTVNRMCFTKRKDGWGYYVANVRNVKSERKKTSPARIVDATSKKKEDDIHPVPELFMQRIA
jgi:hypothetical protein